MRNETRSAFYPDRSPLGSYASRGKYIHSWSDINSERTTSYELGEKRLKNYGARPDQIFEAPKTE